MRFPAFMFWPERYWFDAYDLSDAQHGIYLRILILLWNSPKCKIPNDDGWLSGKLERSVDAVQTEVRPMLARFCKTDGNFFWQTKLLEEYQRLVRLASRSSAGGKALAAKKKALCQTPAEDIVIGDAKQVLNGADPHPHPQSKKDSNSFNGYGKKNGKEHTTIKDPKDRVDRFKASLAKQIGKGGWLIVAAASDESDHNHKQSLEICKQAATALGKGWPHHWLAQGA